METGNSCEVFQSSKRIKASSVIRECSLIENLSATGLVDRQLAFSDGHLSFEHFFVLFPYYIFLFFYLMNMPV